MYCCESSVSLKTVNDTLSSYASMVALLFVDVILVDLCDCWCDGTALVFHYDVEVSGGPS